MLITKQTPLIFMHIPKTGGMSLFTAFTRLWGEDIADLYNISIRKPEEAAPLLRDPGKALYCGHYAYGLHEWLDRPAHYAAVLREPVDRVVSLYYYVGSILKSYRNKAKNKGRSIQELLNDPETPDYYRDFAALLEGEREPSLAGFLDSPCADIDNGMVRRFSGVGLVAGACPEGALETAKENIQRHFGAVGLLERYGETLRLLRQRFQLPELAENRANANRQRHQKEQIDAATQRRIEDLNRLDIELYRWVASRFDAELADPRLAVPVAGGGRRDYAQAPLWYAVGSSPLRKIAMKQGAALGPEVSLDELAASPPVSEDGCYVCGGAVRLLPAALHPKPGFFVCDACGAVGFRIDPKERDKPAPRPPPSYALLVQENRKRYMIERLTQDLPIFAEGRKGRCLEFGAGLGGLPAWWRAQGHEGLGVEPFEPYRAFARHYHRLELSESVEGEGPYDLIVCWHQLEFLPDPLGRLRGLTERLAAEGRLLVSAMDWFGPLEHLSGEAPSQLHDYFSPQGRNAFGRHSLQNLFRLAGLEIEREEHSLSGQSYRLRRGANQPWLGSEEPWQPRIEAMAAALAALREGRAEEATRLWPAFPAAWKARIEPLVRTRPSEAAWLIAEADGILGENYSYRLQRAGWRMQLGDPERALADLRWIAKRRAPIDALRLLIQMLRKRNQQDEARRWAWLAAEINPSVAKEFVNLLAKML